MINNLLSSLPIPEGEERFDQLVHQDNLRIERIISPAHSQTPIYDQEQDEWVLLLQGEARLEVDGTAMTLNSGELLSLPAHTPHRVLDTSATPLCVWLAIHLYPNVEPAPSHQR